jgi:hypothetical protein
MVFIGDPLANCVKLLDCRCELANEYSNAIGFDTMVIFKYVHNTQTNAVYPEPIQVNSIFLLIKSRLRLF